MTQPLDLEAAIAVRLAQHQRAAAGRAADPRPLHRDAQRSRDGRGPAPGQREGVDPARRRRRTRQRRERRCGARRTARSRASARARRPSRSRPPTPVSSAGAADRRRRRDALPPSSSGSRRFSPPDPTPTDDPRALPPSRPGDRRSRLVPRRGSNGPPAGSRACHHGRHGAGHGEPAGRGSDDGRPELRPHHRAAAGGQCRPARSAWCSTGRPSSTVADVLEPWADAGGRARACCSRAVRSRPTRRSRSRPSATATSRSAGAGCTARPVWSTSTPPSRSSPRRSRRLRIFAGYAGWGAGQLEAGDRGGRLVRRTGRAAGPLPRATRRLWRRVLRRQGGQLAMLATMPAEPGLN